MTDKPRMLAVTGSTLHTNLELAFEMFAASVALYAFGAGLGDPKAIDDLIKETEEIIARDLRTSVMEKIERLRAMGAVAMTDEDMELMQSSTRQ